MRKVRANNILHVLSSFPLLPAGEGEKGDKGVLTLFVPFIFAFLFCCISTVHAVQIYPVTKNGRQIQLDGFLLEWEKSESKSLIAGSPWSWDVINTREGLTGYFKAEKQLVCKGPWTFRFLPCRLSPYQSMAIITNANADSQFYRVTHSDAGPDKDVVCEWILPWKKVCHDSTGAYQVGLFAFDACGDTVPPVILTGHVYNPKKISWGGVYGKTVLLAVLLVLLFILQRSTRTVRGKFRNRK